MEIKKVAHLAQSDVETLVAAGKILREILQPDKNKISTKIKRFFWNSIL